MKTYIYYIVFLLAAFVQSLSAQDAPVTKARPPFPALPYTVTYTAAPTGGTVALSVPGAPDPTSIASGAKIYSGTEVTLKVTPATGSGTDYRLVFGYPKVYYTDAASTLLTLNAVADTPGEYTFVMPAHPVTVEVKFEAKPAQPSSDARLKALRYKIGSDGEIPVSGFAPNTYEYDVTLPSSTDNSVQITLSGTAADAGASLPSSPVTINLSSGSGTATLTVTAENRTTTTEYKVNFVKAASSKHIVTIDPPKAGGTITVTDSNGKVIESGAVVDNNTQLTLTNTPVAGYTFSKYTVTGGSLSDQTVTVNSDVTISAEFTPPSEPIQPEEIGTPAVTDENQSVPAKDAPVVIISDAASIPVDTELSQLRLVKEDVKSSKKDKVIKDAKEAIGNTNISDNNIVLMEVTLVKVTTTIDASSGTSETTVTPVQPTDKVKVRIPYPTNIDKSKHDFTIIHLKSDGSTDVYSEAKGNLTLKTDYMEITVTGFSPFAVAYVPKSSPDPGPGPDPVPDPTLVYYTVTLPTVEGATTDPVPGDYEVKSWSSFCFYLTLDKDYDQSVPIVTTSRGETLEPRTSDGAYIVGHVRTPVTISIIGIQKNTDVANATIEAGVKVWTEPSALCLETDRTEEVRVITVSGSTVAVFDAKPGMNRRALAPGLYIIQTPRTVCKVIVR